VCHRAALGHDDPDDDLHEARARAGALLLAELLQDIRLLRSAYVKTS
jgi:hypothetical protein